MRTVATSLGEHSVTELTPGILAGVVLFALLAVWSGGRVFRVGIIMQYQPPKLGNIFRWVVRG